MKFRKLFFLLTILIFFPAVLNARTITFTASVLDPFFEYDNVSLLTAENLDNGYASVQHYLGRPRSNIVRNSLPFDPSSFTMSEPGTFDLTSFIIAGAFGTQTITINGLLDGSILYTESLDITINAQVFSPTGWAGMNQIKLYPGTVWEGTGIQTYNLPFWALDDIELTENPVPIPGAVWLLGSGLIGLAGLRKKFRR